MERSKKEIKKSNFCQDVALIQQSTSHIVNKRVEY